MKPRNYPDRPDQKTKKGPDGKILTRSLGLIRIDSLPVMKVLIPTCSGDNGWP
jgi:hypothetical protein